jgi:hypothetical protein
MYCPSICRQARAHAVLTTRCCCCCCCCCLANVQAHYFKHLPLAVEKEIWLKEQQPGYAAMQRKKFSEWLVDLFREKPDAPCVSDSEQYLAPA